jgi:hypothetical protein
MFDGLPTAAGPVAATPLDFTAHMRRLCERLSSDLPELAHIQMPLVAVRVCQARTASRHGVLASLTPLRFVDGSRFTVRRGRRYRIQPLLGSQGREMLYLLSFYLPRFCDYPFAEKLATVVHELWHVSPRFDGDLRRHPGRCYAHSPRQRDFDAHAAALAEKWLRIDPPAALYDFLHGGFRELAQRHGGVVGARFRTPRLIPADASERE